MFSTGLMSHMFIGVVLALRVHKRVILREHLGPRFGLGLRLVRIRGIKELDRKRLEGFIVGNLLLQTLLWWRCCCGRFLSGQLVVGSLDGMAVDEVASVVVGASVVWEGSFTGMKGLEYPGCMK